MDAYQKTITVVELKLTGQGQNEKGQWSRYTIKDDAGVLYSAFVPTVPEVPGLFPKNIITCVVQDQEKDGKTYHNITKILNVEKGETEITKPSLPDDRDLRIERQVAVKAVVDLAIAGILSEKHPLVLKTLAWLGQKLGVNIPVGSTPVPHPNAPVAAQDGQSEVAKPKDGQIPAEMITLADGTLFNLTDLKQGFNEVQLSQKEVWQFLTKHFPEVKGKNVVEKLSGLNQAQAEEVKAEIESRKGTQAS